MLILFALLSICIGFKFHDHRTPPKNGRRKKSTLENNMRNEIHRLFIVIFHDMVWFH